MLGSGMQDRAALLRLLEWQTAMGADDAVLDSPRDRMRAEAKSAERPRRAPQPAPATPTPAAVANTPQSAMLASAKELADAATDLAALRAAVESFDGCSLRRTATHTVFADGSPAAPLMLIGE